MDQFTSQGLPGALQAVFSGRQNAQASRLNQLLEQAQGQQNDIRGLEVLRSQVMSDPNAVNQYKLAQLAGFQGQQDDAALKRGTLESTMGATNAKNQATIGEKDNEMILQSIEGFLDAAAANQNNPVMALEAVRDLRMKQYLGNALQQMGPEGALKAAVGAREKIIARMADNPTQRGIMEKQTAADAAAKERAEIAARASMYGANQRAAGGRTPSAETTDKAIARLSAIISHPETDEETRAQAVAQLEQIIAVKQRTNPAMNTPRPDVGAIGGLPTVTPRDMAGPGGATRPAAPQGQPQLPAGWTMK
jgi:hypothetical protein